MNKTQVAPHPGRILKNKFLIPLGISGCSVARQLHIQPGNLNDIILERKRITDKMAVRLSHYFNRVSINFWAGIIVDFESDLTGDDLNKAKEAKIKRLLLLRETMMPLLQSLPTLPNYEEIFDETKIEV